MISALPGTLGLTSHDVANLVGLVTLGAMVMAFFWPRELAAFPLVNGKNSGEFTATKAKQRFQQGAHKLVERGFAKSRNAFALLTDTGPRLVLSHENVDFLRNHPHVSFSKHVDHEFMAHIPGFDVFREGSASNNIVPDSIRTKLTQALGLVTVPISEETDLSLREHWTDNPEWHQLTIKPTVLSIVAQLSSRVFLGQEICHNPDWLRITVCYTVDAFAAASSLRLWPRLLRPIVHWFLPACRKIRAERDEARDIIEPVLERRRRYRAEMISQGKEPQRFNDALDWIEQTAKGRNYDAAIVQLGYSLAAIHTTSDMITQVLFDLCEHSELIQPLREEIASVLSQDGWKKTSLYKLKLMDSVIKESQRLKPVTMAALPRYVTQAITLPDGTKIPKHARLIVSNEHMYKSNLGFYEDAEKFDGYRFLRMREAQDGQENTSLLVSTSPKHLGFGHGKNACPGRFFAANEVKIALCHMLLKYDFKFVGGSTPQPQVMRLGFSMMADPRGSLMIRRRREEINLQALHDA